MKTGRALLAGLAGALAMSAAMAALRWAGINADLEKVLGSLVTSDSGVSRWLAGFAIHLAIGACMAWLYAAGFEFAVQSAGVLVGGGLGLSHGLLAGLCMSAIAEMNPYSIQVHSASGAFFLNVSSNVIVGPALFMLLHVLFGAVVGAVYGETIQKPHAFTSSAV